MQSAECVVVRRAMFTVCAVHCANCTLCSAQSVQRAVHTADVQCTPTSSVPIIGPKVTKLV